MVSALRIDRVVRTARAAEPQPRHRALEMPNVVEFATSDRFLGVDLYPLQALLLKLIFLQPELLTKFDYDVLGDWSSGFRFPEGDASAVRFEGNWGIQPDALDRVRRCRAEGRRWFREVTLVVGRRGGKGFLAAICAAYVLWHYLALGDPQAHYGIAPNKRLSAFVFAGQKAQAKGNMWRDIVNVVGAAPCFEPFWADCTTDTLTLWAPNQLQARSRRGGVERPTFEIVAKESTRLGGRGPAAIMLLFDEMSHMVANGANRSADEVWDAATPALAQFGTDAFILEASSPWQQLGRFYENYERSLEVDRESWAPKFQDMFMVQLPSWELYRYWELTR